MSILLLTTTVNVQNKLALREIDPLERIATYTKSLSQWLEKTNFRMVVIENTGHSFPEWEEWKEKYGDRLEVISFRESDVEDAEYLKGNNSKGASEIFAINYARLHSKWIRDGDVDFLIKITGRFFIPGLQSYLDSIDLDCFDILKQNNIQSCQLMGVRLSLFMHLFQRDLFDNNGNYNGNVEEIYVERMLMHFPEERRLICPVFPIEPTLEGGGPNVFHQL
jgi:hypothetical protein